MVSDILREFCVVVVIATLLSLVASFTIVPLLTSRFGKLDRVSDKNIFGRFILWFEDQLHRFTRWVTGVLKWSLNHKFITLATVSVMLFASFGLVAGGYIGGEFFAQGDRGEFLVQIEMPKDASIEQTNQMTQKAEDFLATKPEVVSVITTVGQSNDGFVGTQATAYKAELTVKLTGSEEREDPSNIYAAKLKREMQKVLVGAKVKTVPISIVGFAEQAPFEMVRSEERRVGKECRSRWWT